MASLHRILILRIRLRLWSLWYVGRHCQHHKMQALDGGRDGIRQQVRKKGDVDNLQGDFEDDLPQDPSDADIQNQVAAAAAAAAVLRAQADAQQQAFENQIWGASNDNGATVMAHVQGVTTAAVESFTIINSSWHSWLHFQSECLPRSG